MRLGLLSGLFSTLFLAAATLLFGRIYCAAFCPLGVLQDCLPSGRSRGLKHPIRFALLGVWGASVLLGDFLAMRYLDPYSLFGAVVAGSLIPFGAILALSLTLGGRFWCRELCSIGAGLELLSRHSFFQLAIDQSRCISCGACAKVCSGACIDPQSKTINSGRCIRCMNCLSACRLGAIAWHSDKRARAPKKPLAERRNFLKALTFAAGGTALGSILHCSHGSTNDLIAPPGAGGLSQFLSRCTGCGLCIRNCEGRVLTFRNGVAALDFAKGMCEFSCTNCSNICPTGALKPLNLLVKRRTAIGKARFFPSRCVAVQDGTDCGACAEHCPTGALRMIPDTNGRRVPLLEAALCIGCGNCEHPCPVRPERAIVVESIATQTLAADPETWFRTRSPNEPGDATGEHNTAEGEWLL
ncbi:MAG: 4Fe-4S dicluster domain-containing protein [Kiritimatiellia bacterium]